MTFHYSFTADVCASLVSTSESGLLRAVPSTIIEYNSSRGMYAVSSEKIEWLRKVRDILGIDTGKTLDSIRFGHWARYGYVDGSLCNGVLDEPNRTSGSAINAYFKSHILPKCVQRKEEIDRVSLYTGLILSRKLYN
jgi:hypothetical protein